jgi:hypothetical protein
LSGSIGFHTSQAFIQDFEYGGVIE